MNQRDGQTPTFESSARTMAVQELHDLLVELSALQGRQWHPHKRVLKRADEYQRPTTCVRCGAAPYRHGLCFGCFSDWAGDVEQSLIDVDVLRQLDVDPVAVAPALAAAVGSLARLRRLGMLTEGRYLEELALLHDAACSDTHPTVVEHIIATVSAQAA